MGRRGWFWGSLQNARRYVTRVVRSRMRFALPNFATLMRAALARNSLSSLAFVVVFARHSRDQLILRIAMRLHVALASTVLFASCSAYALEPGQFPRCKFAGLEYTGGATICECPSLKAEAGYASGGPPGSVASRRLQCKEGIWVATDVKCAEVSGRSEYMITEHRKLYNLFCPANSVEKTNSIIARASRSEGILFLSSICRRFGVPSSACSAVLQVISDSQK